MGPSDLYQPSPPTGVGSPWDRSSRFVAAATWWQAMNVEQIRVFVGSGGILPLQHCFATYSK